VEWSKFKYGKPTLEGVKNDFSIGAHVGDPITERSCSVCKPGYGHVARCPQCGHRAPASGN